MATICTHCGSKKSFMDALTSELGSSAYVCQGCQEKLDRAKQLDDEKRIQQIKLAARGVIVTTTPKVDGHYVAEYLGIESVEFVIGTAIFSEMSSSFADLIGARSSAFEKKLQDAKKQAMGALKFLAAEKGANAVIGIDIDYTEFSGNRVALIINGTLVKLAPVPSRLATPSKAPKE
jgi:uncharacterized protein YbjQ (UPF0145 family)